MGCTETRKTEDKGLKQIYYIIFIIFVIGITISTSAFIFIKIVIKNSKTQKNLYLIITQTIKTFMTENR